MPLTSSTRVHPVAARLLLVLALAFSLAACASLTNPNKSESLRRLQYDYSAAIRWGDFEGAWNTVDPEYRKAHPLSEAELSRYSQIQVTSYREMDSATAEDGTVMRNVQIDLVNRNTLSQRNLRYIERWRYDESARRWWIVDGLPDFWRSQ